VKDASSCDARLDKVEATAMQPNDLERKATDPAELLLEKVEYESKSDYGGKASATFILVSLVLFLVTWTKILSLFAVAYFLAGMLLQPFSPYQVGCCNLQSLAGSHTLKH